MHFVDNTTLPVPCSDKLAKVRPVLESIKSTCFTNYVLNRENSIDKAMIKFKGRSSVKQYMPKKPIRRGIKSWVRADSHNGYICDFQIYCGKEGDSGTNLGTRVVTSLSETLKHQYYHLCFDNFFHQWISWRLFCMMVSMHVEHTVRIGGDYHLLLSTKKLVCLLKNNFNT